MKIFNVGLILSILCISLVANENILSNTQLNILNLDNQKSQEDVSKLEKDWLDKNGIFYTYSYSKTDNTLLPDTTKKSILRINQSIFRSGGIYYAIKYASNINEDSKLSIKMQKQNLIIQTLTTVYTIKKFDLQIKKQKLSLRNAIIDYENKRESVFNGLLDISFLNNAILVKNTAKISLLDLEYNKQNTINTLSSLSDFDYKKIPLPQLDLIEETNFQNNNLNIKKSAINIKKQKSLSGVSNAQYLPNVSLNYTKTIDHTLDTDSYTYGFKIEIPINFQTVNAIQSNKIAYLQEKQKSILIKKQEEIFFKSNKLEVQNLSKKISLTKQNIKAYQELLEQTTEQFNAGLKTSNDVEVINNSKINEELSIKIYEIDKQIKLLELYKRIKSDKI